MTEEQNKLAAELEIEVASSRRVSRGWVAIPLDRADEIIAALREREPATEAVLIQALAFFVAVAFGDGYFDGDSDKERIRAWLLNQPLREDITIQEVVESMLAFKGKGASQGAPQA